MADESEDASMGDQNVKTFGALRRGKLGSCTRKMNDIRVLMDANESIGTVKERLKEYKRALNDFINANELLQNLLSEDVKEMERIDWFEPRMATFNDFLHEVDAWMSACSDPQLSVQPEDSISNVSKDSRKSKSDNGSKVSSKASSKMSSTRVKVAAEKAALLTKVEALKRKHVLTDLSCCIAHLV